jgi:(p)ppGpp synthase/HD superfamily hydrolase
MVEIAGGSMKAENGATPRRGKTRIEVGGPPHRPKRRASSIEPAESLETRAREFARAAHEGVGQRRKHTDEPYIVHPMAVAEIVRSVPHSEAMIAAALLHDVVEDTNVGLARIEAEFGSEVAQLVDWLTDVSQPSDGNRRDRKKLDLDHLARAPAEAQTIKYADLIDNSRTISRFDRQFWPVYRREMIALLNTLTRGDERLRRRALDVAAAGSAAAEGTRSG